MKVAKIEIWYSWEWKSWGVLQYNAQGIQVGDGIWVYTKKEAIRVKKELEKKYGLKK
jgi:hypothetical protein